MNLQTTERLAARNVRLYMAHHGVKLDHIPDATLLATIRRTLWLITEPPDEIKNRNPSSTAPTATGR